MNFISPSKTTFWRVLVKNKHIILLSIIILFQLVNNIVIINLDQTDYSYDLANVRLKSIEYFESISKFNLSSFIHLFTNTDLFYPPLYMLSSIPLYFVFGTAQDISAHTNIFYYIILLVSVFYLGKKLVNKDVGLTSSTIVSFLPGIYSFSRIYLADFALTSMVALSLCLLVYSDKFNNKKFTFLFGISCGFGVMIKWSFLTYIIGPSIIYFYYSFKKNFLSLNNIKKLKFLALSLFIGMLVCLPWYYNKIDFLLDRGISLNKDYAVQIGGYDAISIENFKQYINMFYPMVFGSIPSYLFISLLLFFIWPKTRNKMLIISWILVPYIILTLAPWKNPRYLLPFAPAHAIIISIIFERIIRKFHKKHLIKFLIYTLCLSLLVTGFISSNYTISQRTTSSIGLFKYGLLRPGHTNYKLNEIIKNFNHSDNQPISLQIIPNSELLDSLFHEIKFQKLNIMVDRGLFCIGSGGRSNCGPDGFSRYQDKEFLCEQDYIIDYDTNFSYETYVVINLPIESPLHNQVIMPLIENWNSCKNSNYQKIYSRDILIRSKTVPLSIYKKH